MKEANFSKVIGKRRRILVDISAIEKISIGAALVLAAEFHRAKEIKKTTLKPYRLGHWNLQVKGLLDDLGLFELLEVDPGRGHRRSFDDTEIAVLPFTSCDDLDRPKIGAISQRLSEVAEVFQHDPLIYDAMIEAAYNCCIHAYPENYEYEYQPLPRRWWSTASWSPRRQEIRFLVYDQGVGIFETLPRYKHYERVLAAVADHITPSLPFVKAEAHMIAAALEVGRTSRGGGHGQGLQDVVAPIDEYARGRLRILSGRGCVIYSPQSQVTKIEHSQHLGGTLIEWTLPVEAFEESRTP